MSARTTASIADAVLASIPSLSAGVDQDVQMRDADSKSSSSKTRSSAKEERNEKKRLRELMSSLEKIEMEIGRTGDKLLSEVLPGKIATTDAAASELFGPSLVSMTRSPLKETKRLSASLPVTPTKAATPVSAIGTRSPAGGSSSSSSSSSSSATASGGFASPAVARAFSVPPPSAAVQSVLPRMKSELRDMVDVMKSLKLVVQLNMPAIGDDDVGQEIQEQAVNMLAKFEDEGFGLLSTFSTYNLARGKLVAKTLKFPDVEDFWEAITQVDEEMHLKMKIALGDMKSRYILIRDVMTKNADSLAVAAPMEDDESLF